MKNTNLKNTGLNTGLKAAMLSTAIALAMGFSASQLQAGQGQAAGQIDPQTSTQGQVNQPVNQPTDGQQLADQVNRAAATEDRTDTDHDPIDAEDFVETASAKGIAEIDSARLALEEGSPAVRTYANKIIEDHTVTNNELKAIAERVDLDVADDASLMDRAKEFVLSVRDGADFDEAYIENQIAAHEESIELFQRAAQSSIPEISAFASGKLPALQEHLRMANALRTQISTL